MFELLLISGMQFPKVPSYKLLLLRNQTAVGGILKRNDVFQGNAMKKRDKRAEDPGCCFFLLTVGLW